MAIRSIRHLSEHGPREARRQLALSFLQTCLRHLDVFAAAPLVRSGFDQAGVRVEGANVSWPPPWTLDFLGLRRKLTTASGKLCLGP